MLLIRRLGLGIALILAASAILLVSDLKNRTASTRNQNPNVPVPATVGSPDGKPVVVPGTEPIKVAIFQYASNTLLDDAAHGVLAGLASKGFHDGENIRVTRFNAEGDLNTGNQIAAQIINDNFPLVISETTVCLQAVANANRNGRAIHLFGLVSDPKAAGVGIDKMNSASDKPAHLTGIGTLQPVAEIFELARKFRPELRRVGVVWNPAEVNSEVTTRLAREAARAMGIELLEAPIASSNDVREAASALVSQGVEAFWTGGDATVANAIDTLIDVARQARLPVFSNITGHAQRGSTFDLGADYGEVGFLLGQMGGDILNGISPADIAVENVVPERIILNERARRGLRDKWTFTGTAMRDAQSYIDENGKIEEKRQPREIASKAAPPSPDAPDYTKGPPTKKFNIHLIDLVEAPASEQTYAGIVDGLKDSGMVEGKDFSLKKLSAHGDLSLLSTLVDNAITDQADMIYTISTPALQAALAKVQDRPVLFALALNPLLIGDKGTEAVHKANVAGVYDRSPFEAMIAVIKQMLPDAKRIGTLYNPAEANSVNFRDDFFKVAKAAGIELVSVPSNTTAEVPESIRALLNKNIDAVCQINDNLHDSAFPAIVRAADTAKIPVFSFSIGQVEQGGSVVVSNDHFAAGKASAQLAAQVMRGQKPGAIPYAVVDQVKININPDKSKVEARKLVVPPALRAWADGGPMPDGIVPAPPKPAAVAPPRSVVPLKPGEKKVWRVQMISYTESPPSEETHAGVMEGMKLAGLVEGTDYTVQFRSAQNDMSLLGNLFDAAKSEGADLFVTFSTPTLQVGLKKVQPPMPLIFTFVANPFILGAGKSATEHLPNVTGVYSASPIKEMVVLLRKNFPNIKRIATLYCPAEVNSVYYKDQLVEMAQSAGMHVDCVPAQGSAEVTDAAMAMVANNLDAVVQISDNLSATSFAPIAKAAKSARLPVFSFMTAAIKDGAVLTLARDFRDAGIATGKMVAQVVNGTSPADIPIQPPPTTVLTVNPGAAISLGLSIPPALIQQAAQQQAEAAARHPSPAGGLAPAPGTPAPAAKP